MIQSPLNYTGGKYKLLPQILPLFPPKINTFVDLFCGGCNVGINVQAENIIFNDIDKNIGCLFNTFKNLGFETMLSSVKELVVKHNLSDTAKHGYDFYNCDSSKGLGEYNKSFFLELRNDFNKKKTFDYHYYIMLYTLIVFSFNNQIRFNSKNEFNLPVGKRDFNIKMQDKLKAFIARLQEVDSSFSSVDFRKLDTLKLGENDFVYADPPYLITCASYNENGGWSENLEKDLLSFLEALHEQKIKFALSNVLRSKGKENIILLNWLDENKEKYKAIHLSHSYSNSNYQTKDKTTKSEEVLIVNY